MFLNIPLPYWGSIGESQAWLQPKPFMKAGPFNEWPSTITEIAKAICELFFAVKSSPAAARKTSPRFIGKRNLRSASQKCTCGSREKFTKADTCHKAEET